MRQFPKLTTPFIPLERRMGAIIGDTAERALEEFLPIFIRTVTVPDHVEG